MAKNTNHNDFNSLPERSDKARRGINELSNAFDELSRSGTVTHGAVRAIAGALSVVPHPAAQAAAVLVQVGSAVLKASENAERFSETRLQFNLREIAQAAEEARTKVAAFQSSMLAGDSERAAALKAKIDQIRREQDSAQDDIRASIAMAKQNAGGFKYSDIPELEKKSALYLKVANERIRLLNIELAAEQKTGDAFKMNALVIRSLGVPALAEWLAKKTEEKRLQGELNAALADAQVRMQALIALQNQKRIDDYNAALERQGLLWKDYGQSVALAGATNALNAYYDALDKTVSLNAIFAGSFDRAMRNAAASTVRAVGQEAAVRAIFELADGFRYLGTPGMQGLAAFHFKSAAIFGTIALGAGPAAGLLSVMPSGGGFGGSGRGREEGGGRERGGPRISITVIGAPDFSTKQTIAGWVAEMTEEGAV